MEEIRIVEARLRAITGSLAPLAIAGACLNRPNRLPVLCAAKSSTAREISNRARSTSVNFMCRYLPNRSSAAALGAVYQLGLLLFMFAARAEMRRLLHGDTVRSVGLVASLGWFCRSQRGSGWWLFWASAALSAPPATRRR
jgi:hypothetical protein